jgi:hypothetical protein
MSMELTFYMAKPSRITKDKYYIDMIVTCDNGTEEVITFFSEKEVSIEETNHET